MLDFEAIAQAIFDNAVAALGRSALLVERRARQKAPVRHIFADGSYHVRVKTWGEIDADRAIRASLDLGPELKAGRFRAKTTLGAPIFRNRKPTGRNQQQYLPPRNWEQRRMAAAAGHLADYDAEMARRKAGQAPQPTFLTRQGAYEVRTKRAKATTWGHAYIGGRLRREIFATAPEISGAMAEAWVIAPTPYAKYQEFGTRHNAAHPFLRPALDESREEIVSRIAAAVREASRTSGSHTDIEIVVRL